MENISNVVNTSDFTLMLDFVLFISATKMRETIASRLRGTRKPDIQKTTPTQVFCTGVSLLNLDVLHGSS